LESIFSIIPRLPYTAFVPILPKGVSLEDTKKRCESQSVNLKIDFFNLANEQLPIWEDQQKVDEKYSYFLQQYLDEQAKSFFSSASESRNVLRESRLLDIPKADEYISDEDRSGNAMVLAKKSMDQLQQHKIDSSLMVEDFSALENSLTNLQKMNVDKNEVENLRTRFNQVVSDGVNQQFDTNIEMISKLFAEVLDA
jgi:hypothetical protein